jgi:hypothetical protein
MKLFLSAAAITIIALAVPAYAEPIDCTNLIGEPKNLGQLNKVVRETGIFSGQNVPSDGRLFGVPVNEWIHTQVFEVCNNGPGQFGEPQ